MRTGPTSEVSCPRFFCAQHLKQMYDGKWCYGRQPGSSLQVLQGGAQNQEEKKMKRYRLYLNEVYSGVKQVDFDGVLRFVEIKDDESIFVAMDVAFRTAKELGCHAYRLMEGGKAEYKLTAAFASWFV